MTDQTGTKNVTEKKVADLPPWRIKAWEFGKDPVLYEDEEKPDAGAND
jgi:hypothetical protein